MGNILWGIRPVYVTPEVYHLPAYLIPHPLTRVDWTRIGHLNQLEPTHSFTSELGVGESSSV